MAIRIIVLSGPVASGKSTLAAALNHRYGLRVFKTKAVLKERFPDLADRGAFQRAGEELDEQTQGKWVAQALGRVAVDEKSQTGFIVDSCRRKEQIDGLRQAFGSRVVHLHLFAPDRELERRYTVRASDLAELDSYREVKNDPTEAQVASLAEVADIVIDTDRCTESDVVVRAGGHLGMFGRGYPRLVDILIGGQWGSEGKGHVASYLASEYEVLVRVGGPNAGHTVYLEDGPFTYHQLPSGTHAGEGTVVIGAGAVIRVPDLLDEIARCQLPRDRLVIDPQAMVIEDRDIKAERRRLLHIGSTKRGVGVAVARKVLRSAADRPVRLARDIQELQPYIHEAREVLDDAFRHERRVFLEGTQGTGLSLHHGSYPYVTSRETSVSGCLAEAGIAPSRVRRTMMVFRTHPIRVGGEENSGPMDSEISWKEVSRRSGIPYGRLLKTERTSTTKRRRRVAEFSWTLLRKAASLNGPTDLALSFADYIDRRNEDARRFEQLTPETIEFVEEVERVAGAPVSLIVTRFSHASRSIIDRRRWGAK